MAMFWLSVGAVLQTAAYGVSTLTEEFLGSCADLLRHRNLSSDESSQELVITLKR